MIYSSNIGKIYDTIFFFVEYFNKDEIDKNYTKVFEDTSFMIECFNEIESEAPEIPDILYPLFYNRNGIASPVSSFFSAQIDFINDDIDSFTTKMMTNMDLIYRQTVEVIFGRHLKSENKDMIPAITPGNYIEALNSLDVPLEFKYQISLLFGNFNYAISVLAGLMKKIYSLVSDLHINHYQEIEKVFRKIQSETNIEFYSNAIKYDSQAVDDTIVSITLLNQYIVYGPRTMNEKVFLMFGYRHEEWIMENSSVDFIDTNQFIVVCGNEFRLKILKIIAENDELTSSQIARIIGCPVTSMIRHIEVLNRYDIIYLSKREGLQMFYKINIKLFKKMKNRVIELFDDIINSNEGNKKNDK